jgi:hypothetical protein
MDFFSEGLDAALQTLQVLFPLFMFMTITSIVVSIIYKICKRGGSWNGFLMLLSLSFLGGTIGTFMGASGSPIVSAILPSVITLISGYLILYEKNDLPEQVKIILLGAVFLLLLNLLFSAFYMKNWYNLIDLREINKIKEDVEKEINSTNREIEEIQKEINKDMD